MKNKNIIALDGDGVLLDYHTAYQQAWGKAFGDIPKVKDPLAYWPKDRYEVRHLTGSDLHYFRSFFNEEFWSTIPPIERAVEACKNLKEQGFELVCLTALDHQFKDARLSNLMDCGFPIEQVITTPSKVGSMSPKADILRDINAIAFVDDYLPYFGGVSRSIHKALIMREPNGTPNKGVDIVLVDSLHDDLYSFSVMWQTRN
jgi:phosphoglycolate phosphatase-like HAD superfamily hydrolase